MSYLTTIYAVKSDSEYVSEAKKLFLMIVLVSFIIIFLLYLFSKFIISFLYGPEYYGAIKVFRVLLFYQFFWVIGFYFSRLIVKFNGYRFLAYKSFFVCVLNLCLAFLLIRKIGVLGAAYAALIVEVFSALVINLFYKKASLLQVIFFYRKRDEA